MKLRKQKQPSKTTFFSIDPGITGTGIAVFITEELLEHAVFEGTRGEVWEYRSTEILNRLKNTLERNKITNSGVNTLYIERPKFMQSGKGWVSASSDGLFKLIFHYGRIFQLFHSYGIQIVQKPVTWKGTLSKKQTEFRLKKLLPNFKPIADHDCDAVAMGLHVMGRFG